MKRCRRNLDVTDSDLCDCAVIEHCKQRAALVPLAELQDALASEGAKDYRIEALEAALDWALPAVFHHYTEGEAPSTPGAYEELEKARARVISECQRLSELSALNAAPDPTSVTHKGE